MIPFDSSSKRAQIALRFFTYGVMTLATIVLTTLAIFYAMGYRFNQNSLSFEQGGLLQFQSAPEGAQVYIDGKKQSYNTPGRANMPVGKHTVEMRLDGYKNWSKTIDLKAGQLLWLNYTRLIPQDLAVSSVRSFPSLTATLASPDRRWIALQELTNAPAITIADVGNEKEPKFSNITIPDATLTKKDGKLGKITIVEWDLGSRYLLLLHENAEVREYIRLDRSEPEKAVNISRVFRLPISEAHFAGSNPNVLFVKTDNILRRLDIGSSSASAALVADVSQFVVYGGDDVIAFVAKRTAQGGQAQQVVGMLKGSKETLVRTTDADVPLKIAFTEYFRNYYFAVSDGSGKVDVVLDPESNTSLDGTMNKLTTFDLGKPVQWLKFSNNGRMLVAGNGKEYANYDLELDITTPVTLSNVSAEVTRPLEWLDDYHIWTDADSTLHTYEFDGQNNQNLGSVTPGFMVNLSQNGKSLFTIGKNTQNNTFELQSTRLIKD